MESDLPIRWAPKVRQDKIWRLYQNDARGLIDETLLEDVGLALFLRCESILMVLSGSLRCPRCQTSFVCVRYCKRPPHDVLACPDCQWGTTEEQYTQSHRDKDLSGYGATDAFKTFVERYPIVSSARERMLLIDRLIHAFHHSLRGLEDTPHRPAAVNLIEGNQKNVITFLDRLTYGEANAPEVQQTRTQWETGIEQMRSRRE